jgi:pimeloyl-ACP methyl ester carboxylesterase
VQLEPRLIETAVPDDPEGVVLVLHGGAARRTSMAVSPTQLSVVRMIPIARRAARAGGGRLAVFRLLNSQRGWDTTHTPVHDAHWALGQIAERLGGALPACLIGHSLGGRAALLSASHPDVRSAVALAPWVYPDDAPRDLSGKRILIVHGSEDRIAIPDRSAAVARALQRTTDTAYVTIDGGKHAMLRHGRRFDGLAADFAATTLLGEPTDGILARVDAGEAWVTV